MNGERIERDCDYYKRRGSPQKCTATRSATRRTTKTKIAARRTATRRRDEGQRRKDGDEEDEEEDDNEDGGDEDDGTRRIKMRYYSSGHLSSCSISRAQSFKPLQFFISKMGTRKKYTIRKLFSKTSKSNSSIYAIQKSSNRR